MSADSFSTSSQPTHLSTQPKRTNLKTQNSAGLPQLADTFVSDPSAHFSAGQSVRALVTDVDAERRRFSVSLKPSALAGGSGGDGTGGDGAGAYLDALLRDSEAAAALQAAAEREAAGGAAGAGEAIDWDGIEPGALVTGRVAPDGVKPYGLQVDLDAAPDAVGLLTPELGAAGGAFAPGQALRAVVADVAKGEGIVDLATLDALVSGARGGGSGGGGEANGGGDGDEPAVQRPPRRKVKAGRAVEAVVRALKPHYAIASVPELGEAIAFLAPCGFNTAPVDAAARAGAACAARGWAPGARVAARVAALPSAANGHRLVLEPAAAPAAAAGGKGAAAAAGAATANGKQPEEREAVVTATVVAVGPLGLEVAYGKVRGGKGG